MIRARLDAAGCRFDAFHIELLGAGDATPGLAAAPRATREIVLRVAVRAPEQAMVERFTKEFAPLVTSGPAGLAGYASGRSPVRPVFAYWPTLAPRDFMTSVETHTAAQWLTRPEPV
jgi:hypothetical protein